MKASASWPFAAALAAFVALLGLLPHLRFSLLLGEPTYFFAAYDEPAYALYAFEGGGPLLPHRWLSSAVLTTLAKLGGGSWGAALVLADLLLPACCALLAFALAGHVTRRRLLRLALALGLLFAQELFSLGCWTIWRVHDPLGVPSPEPPVYDLRDARALAPAWLEKLWPDYASPSLTLFRTPEPQLSLILLYGLLAILVELCQERVSVRRRRALMALGAVVNLVLVATYFFVATAIVAFEWALCLALVTWRRRAPPLSITVLVSVGTTSALAGVSLFHSTGAAQGYSFSSHLPVLTPATVVAVLGLLALLSRLWRGNQPAEEPITLAAACFGSVLFLTNQQVVSGRMISTQHWERFVDYPLVVMGVALAGGWMLRRARVRTDVLHACAGAGLVAACGVLVQAQDRVFEEQFLVANLKSVAMKRAVEAVEASGMREVDWLFEEPDLDLFLEARLERRVSHLLDLSHVFDNPLDPLSVAGGRWGPRSPFTSEAFEYFARRPRPAGAVERILRREAEAGAGVFLRFFFDPRDFWATFTDARRARLADIQALLPTLRTDYDSYLEAGDVRWSRPVVVLTRQSAVERADSRWAERLLVEVTVGRDRPLMNMHAYLQTRRAD